MRECEEQISGLKKENFNLKLRIYFMEQSQGQVHGAKDQENLYKVNIDLKVTGEVLKKDLEEQRGLLSEAARALQVQEERCRGRVEQVQEQLRGEVEGRREAEVEAVRMEREVQRREEGEGKLSDQSKLLYSEAFGSINLGREEGREEGREDTMSRYTE